MLLLLFALMFLFLCKPHGHAQVIARLLAELFVDLSHKTVTLALFGSTDEMECGSTEDLFKTPAKGMFSSKG